MISTEALETIGKAWTKPGTDEVRYYVNDWQGMIGLEVGYYKTGNVSDVEYRGEHRSNCWYKKYVQDTRVWIGEDGEVHVDHCRDSGVERAVKEALGQRIAAMEVA